MGSDSHAIELGHDHTLDPETSVTNSLILAAVRWVSGDLESAAELPGHTRTLAASHGLSPLTSRIDVVRPSVLNALEFETRVNYMSARNDDPLMCACGRPTPPRRPDRVDERLREAVL